MNPTEVLGKKFDVVERLFENSGIREVYDCLEEGELQEYYVSALNDSWEFLLENGDTIKTIFLYLSNGYGEYDGIGHFTKREEVFRKYGEPSHRGEEKVIPMLGVKGAWERYDNPKYSLHIEHSVGSDTIEKITLMLARVAP